MISEYILAVVCLVIYTMLLFTGLKLLAKVTHEYLTNKAPLTDRQIHDLLMGLVCIMLSAVFTTMLFN